MLITGLALEELKRHACDLPESFGLDRKIDRAVANRAVSQREAQGLHRDAREVKQLYSRYANRGLSVSEYRTLERRVAAITARLHEERRDRDGRRG